MTEPPRADPTSSSPQLVQALLSEVSYERLAQAAADAIPSEFAPEAAVLGALLCRVDTSAHTIRAIAFTRGHNRAVIEAALAGHEVVAFAGDYRQEANLVQVAAAQNRTTESDRLHPFLAGSLSEEAAGLVERSIGWRGGVAVPVPVQQRNVGVLLYALGKPPQQLSAGERERLLRTTQLVGLALEQARLFDSERRQARETAALEGELEATFQAVGEAIALYDQQGRVVRLNRAMERLLGLPAGAFLGLSQEERSRRFHTTTLGGEEIPPGELPISRALRGETVRTQLRLVRQDDSGSETEVDLVATPMRGCRGADGDPVGLGAVTVMRDIGPELRRRRELEALIESGKQVGAEIDQAAVLRAIAAAAADSVLAKGAAVAVVETDRASDEGYAAERLVFREWYKDHAWQLMGEERRPWEGPAGRALATGQLQLVTPHSEETTSGEDARRGDLPAADRDESVLALPIGSRRRILAVVVLLGKRNGRAFDEDDVRLLRAFAEQAVAALENARLYEEERRARRELEEAQEQGQVFLSFIAHELKTPLTNILGFAQLIDRYNTMVAPSGGINPNERIANAVRKILDNTRRLQHMVEDLQEAFRIGSGRFTLRRERCDLTVLARQVADEQQALSEQHHFTFTAPQDPIVGSWDTERLRQLLTNLMSNAVKYSPEGGPVGVTLRRSGERAVLVVADRGLGVPAEDIPALFQPYSRLHRSRAIKGTGLGLYIVKGIIDAHGGSIKAESAGVGKGAAFTVILPLESPAETAGAPPAIGAQ